MLYEGKQNREIVFNNGLYFDKQLKDDSPSFGFVL